MSLLTIVQARTGSTRHPGKTLAEIGGRAILEWVIHRLDRTRADIGPIVVATTARGADNDIEHLCRMMNIPCYRGPEHDVLRRYHLAALHHRNEDTTGVVRVTADCPLLCPELLASTCDLFNATQADYAGVHGAPNGFGQEIIGLGALATSFLEARIPEDREHVITYVESQPDRFKLAYVQTADWMFDRRGWRFTLDYPADFDLMRDLYAATDGRLFDLTSREILDAVAADAPMRELASRQP